MNIQTIIYGLISLLIGLIGVILESRKSLKDKRNEGWTVTRSKSVVGSWALIIAGVILIVLGLFDID